jgi:hypothetical protein
MALVVLLIGYVASHASLPLGNAVLIGADEGFELAKATLRVNGHALYSEVWNDQPPLHTFLVAQIMKRVSTDVLVPRFLTVMAGVVLLGGMFWLVYRGCGLGVACLTVGLIIASPGFLKLSASCMLEIPSLAPAVVALGVLWSWRSRWHAGEIVAGALFGAALLVKLLPVILLPLAMLIVWMRNRRLEVTGSVGGRKMGMMAPTDVGGYLPRGSRARESALNGSRAFGSNGLSAPSHDGGYGPGGGGRRDDGRCRQSHSGSAPIEIGAYGGGVGRSIRGLLVFASRTGI